MGGNTPVNKAQNKTVEGANSSLNHGVTPAHLPARKFFNTPAGQVIAGTALTGVGLFIANSIADAKEAAPGSIPLKEQNAIVRSGQAADYSNLMAKLSTQDSTKTRDVAQTISTSPSTAIPTVLATPVASVRAEKVKENIMKAELNDIKFIIGNNTPYIVIELPDKNVGSIDALPQLNDYGLKGFPQNNPMFAISSPDGLTTWVYIPVIGTKSIFIVTVSPATKIDSKDVLSIYPTSAKITSDDPTFITSKGVLVTVINREQILLLSHDTDVMIPISFDPNQIPKQIKLGESKNGDIIFQCDDEPPNYINPKTGSVANK